MGSRAMLALTAACICFLLASSVVDATPGCTTTTKPHSQMFGATPSKPSWVLYTQETFFRAKGDMTKLNLYYNENEKCVRGIKPTYSYDARNAARLGVEKDSLGVALASVDLKLKTSEVFVKAEYKVRSACIEYISFTTNKNRQVTIGNVQSSSPLQSAVAEAGVFLAFFNGLTDVPNNSAKTGNLQQLQVVWATRTCPKPSAPATPTPVSSPSPAASPVVQPPPQATSPSPAPPTMPPPQATSPSPAPPTMPPVPATTTDAGPVCTPAKFCQAGKCPTSTCAFNGMGVEVLQLLCYSTNVMKNVVLEATIGNPCRNLACKLDVNNCKSFGLGVGGFCTGTVTAMADTSKLHVLGLPWLGYPCIEYKGPLVDAANVVSTFVNPAQDNGTYSQTAWKACNCLGSSNGNNGISASINTVLNITLPQPSLSIPSLTELVKKPVINMTLPEVLAQWITANQLTLAVPNLELTDVKINALKALIPGFVAPSLIIPNISWPLLKAPSSLNLSIPVFTVPAATLKSVSLLLPNLTSLPSIIRPTSLTPTKLPVLKMPNITAPNFLQLAKSLITADTGMEGLVNSLSSLPGLDALQSLQSLLPGGLAGIDFTGLATLVKSLPTPTLNITGLSAMGLNLDGLEQVTSLFQSVITKLGTDSASDSVTTAADSMAAGESLDDASESLPAGASAATAYMAPAEFAALPADEKKALLALYG